VTITDAQGTRQVREFNCEYDGTDYPMIAETRSKARYALAKLILEDYGHRRSTVGEILPKIRVTVNRRPVLREVGIATEQDEARHGDNY